MAMLEQLALSTAQTLLTYLQYACLKDEAVGAEALAAVFCEALTQLEDQFPSKADQFGWTKVGAPLGVANEISGIESDLHR